jgi:galactose mutarotase-like enzyme
MPAHGRDVTISDGELSATFLPTLGMVCSSLRHEGEELLAQLGGPAAYAERGSTFGIPLLHPWANRLSAWSYDANGEHVELDPSDPHVHKDSATGLPIHGLLAANPGWTVSHDTDNEIIAEFDFGAHPELLALFPFPHRLELRATVTDGARLTIALTVTPTGNTAVPISFGWHPYLTLPGGSDRRTWALELPVLSRALLDEHQIPTGEHDRIAPGALSGPLGDRTFDDAFDALQQGRPFSIADDRRRIALTFDAGYDVAQVYAPPDSTFICFEPMTAPVDALTHGRGLRWAQPGDPFTAAFSVVVSAS